MRFCLFMYDFIFTYIYYKKKLHAYIIKIHNLIRYTFNLYSHYHLFDTNYHFTFNENNYKMKKYMRKRQNNHKSNLHNFSLIMQNQHMLNKHL